MININNLITIIIPVYNPPISRFRRCLKSVFEQSYKNIEIIIIDDGSEKKVKDVLKEIDDKRVRIFYQENMGVSAARNRGIKLAKGKYISFVDADDYIDKYWISNSANYLKQDYDIVFGKVIMCNDENFEKVYSENIPIYKKEYRGNALIKVQEMLLMNDAISPLPYLSYLDLGPCGKLYKKATIKNIIFPMNVSLGEDQVFNNTVVKKSKKVLITNCKAYYYIQNNKSASHVFKKGALETMTKAMRLVYKQLISKNEINAFYYSVILNISVALSLQHQSLKSDINLISSIYNNDNFPIYNAIHKIKILALPGIKPKLRAFIFKYHLIYLNYIKKVFAK